MRGPFEVLMADIVKRDLERLDQSFKFFMIADYRANLRRQLAGVMADQKIAKTVRFSRRHDHNRLLLRGGQFHDGSLRKNLFEIRNHPSRRRRSLKRRAQKKCFASKSTNC